MAISKRSALFVGLIVAPLLTAIHVGGAASASQEQQQLQQQQTVFPGKSLFTTYCATCHGTSGKGDGPFAASLRKRPADLTQLAKHNEGSFPTDRVMKSVDGRDAAVAHGSDMPVWGDAFSRTKEDNDPESVQRKIRAIVLFIQSIQERPASVQ
jgi:mono/diheme cytochrome c family protein